MASNFTLILWKSSARILTKFGTLFEQMAWILILTWFMWTSFQTSNTRRDVLKFSGLGQYSDLSGVHVLWTALALELGDNTCLIHSFQLWELKLSWAKTVHQFYTLFLFSSVPSYTLEVFNHSSYLIWSIFEQMPRILVLTQFLGTIFLTSNSEWSGTKLPDS